MLMMNPQHAEFLFHVHLLRNTREATTVLPQGRILRGHGDDRVADRLGLGTTSDFCAGAEVLLVVPGNRFVISLALGEHMKHDAG
jgi:hypothetical protein